MGKVDGELVVDLDKIEDNYGESDTAVVISPRTNEILLFQMEGLMTPQEVKRTVRLAGEAALEVRKLQAGALQQRYAQIAEQGVEQ